MTSFFLNQEIIIFRVLLNVSVFCSEQRSPGFSQKKFSWLKGRSIADILHLSYTEFDINL